MLTMCGVLTMCVCVCVCVRARSGHRIGNKFAAALSASMQRLNPPPSHVFLRDNRLDSKGARRLLLGIATSDLMVLDIGNNRLGRNGALVLAQRIQVRVLPGASLVCCAPHNIVAGRSNAGTSNT